MMKPWHFLTIFIVLLIIYFVIMALTAPPMPSPEGYHNPYWYSPSTWFNSYGNTLGTNRAPASWWSYDDLTDPNQYNYYNRANNDYYNRNLSWWQSYNPVSYYRNTSSYSYPYRYGYRSYY